MVNPTSPDPEVHYEGRINPNGEQQVEGWERVRAARDLAQRIEDFAMDVRDSPGWARTAVELFGSVTRLRFAAENEQFRLERVESASRRGA